MTEEVALLIAKRIREAEKMRRSGGNQPTSEGSLRFLAVDLAELFARSVPDFDFNGFIDAANGKFQQ